MRLDRRKGDYPWQVWDCEWCRPVPEVVWVDSDTAQWGQYARPRIIVHGELLMQTHQAKRIVIVQEQRMVLINPVDDDKPVAEQTISIASTSTENGRVLHRLSVPVRQPRMSRG